MRIGRSSTVNDSCRAIYIVLQGQSHSVYRLALTFRLYDDAIAVRSEVLADDIRTHKLSLLNEDFVFNFLTTP